MKIIIFVMNPEKYFERRKALKLLLEKTPFQFKFIAINDDKELTPDSIKKNHDSKRTIDSFGRDFSRGELASTLNHLLSYEKFLYSENDLAIIMEDDADFIVDEFIFVIERLIKIIDKSKPQVFLLTPVVSYLNNNSRDLSKNYKVVKVIQSWDSSGYVINRKAAEKMIKANSKSWFIADDWVRYKRHAKVDLFSVIPTVIKQNLSLFDSNLMASRNKAIKTKSLKYILSRLGSKIIADTKKYFWLIPFRGYIKNKDV
ncbi:glycosyltransferase family 25 protein [Candidatus Thioglobus sp.]|nr:glycosyltransferase family 25 protein [Candidatus Thioglobus sp.]